MIGSVAGALGSNQKVWQGPFLSQCGRPSIPDAGHHIWAQLPKASHPNGGPSGGAHRGSFTSAGEHLGWASAVVGARPITARFRAPEMTAVAANPATTGRCMAVSFRPVPPRWHWCAVVPLSQTVPADRSSHMRRLPHICADRPAGSSSYAPSAGPMVVFQDSCISDSNSPQVWEPSGRTT
jgi:hypothetical protein